MARSEWGTKRICQNCGGRFYDLRRSPPTCPKCGAVHTPRALVRHRRTPGSGAVEVVEPVNAVAAVVVPVEEERAGGPEGDAFADDDDAEEAEEAPAAEAEAEEETLMEDASELGEDDDDVSEVMEHVDDDFVDRG